MGFSIWSNFIYHHTDQCLATHKTFFTWNMTSWLNPVFTFHIYKRIEHTHRLLLWSTSCSKTMQKPVYLSTQNRHSTKADWHIWHCKSSLKEWTFYYILQNLKVALLLFILSNTISHISKNPNLKWFSIFLTKFWPLASYLIYSHSTQKYRRTLTVAFLMAVRMSIVLRPPRGSTDSKVLPKVSWKM